MATPPRPARLYRLVRTQHPSWSNFLSSSVQDQPPRLDELANPLLWAGVSTFDTEAGARGRAQQYRALGRFIAELLLPDDAPVLILKTLGSGHWTVVGGPGVLLGYVVAPILRV